MNLFKEFQGWIKAELEVMVTAGELPAGLDLGRVVVEPPRDATHGELSTNAAMVLAKPAKLQPRQIAEALVQRLKRREGVTEASIAGPGFVNWRLDPALWREELRAILRAGPSY